MERKSKKLIKTLKERIMSNAEFLKANQQRAGSKLK